MQTNSFVYFDFLKKVMHNDAFSQIGFEATTSVEPRVLYMCAELIRRQIDFYLQLEKLQKEFKGDARAIFELYACDDQCIPIDGIKHLCERIRPVTNEELHSILRFWDRDCDG